MCMCVDSIIILFNTDMFIYTKKSYIHLVHVHVCMWLTSVQECILMCLVISLVVLTPHW